MSEEFDELDDFIEDSYEVISMVLDDGEVLECFVIDGIDIENVQYLLVVSCDDFDNDEPDAFILKQIDEENENAIYELVEDDNEYNKVLVLLQENETDYEIEFD